MSVLHYRFCPLDLVFDRCFLTMSYNSMNDAQCRGFCEYTGKRKTSNMTKHVDMILLYPYWKKRRRRTTCNKIHQSILVTTSSNGLLLHSVLQQNHACDYKPCSTHVPILFVNMYGNSIAEGPSSFVTEFVCWSHKNKAGGVVAPHPFWECSEPSNNLEEKDNAACYLFSSQEDVLNEYILGQST